MRTTKFLRIIVSCFYACCGLSTLFLYTHSSAIEDDIKKASSIAASGARVQAERLKTASENLANEDSAASTPGGKPYLRKVVFTENRFDPKVKSNLLKVKKVVQDEKTPLVRKYDPNHPGADMEGYVDFPNVSREIEMGDIREAQVSYEANLSVIEVSRGIMQRTIEAIK
jgi:flagellar basal-body rod protein FlgC